MVDEVRGKLARKIQERERESEAQIELPVDPVSRAQSQEDEVQAGMRLPTVLIWTVAVVVGIATSSVPLGLGVLVVGQLLLRASIALRRVAS